MRDKEDFNSQRDQDASYVRPTTQRIQLQTPARISTISLDRTQRPDKTFIMIYFFLLSPTL